MGGVHHGHHSRHGHEGALGVGGGLLGSQLKLGDRLAMMMLTSDNADSDDGDILNMILI